MNQRTVIAIITVLVVVVMSFLIFRSSPLQVPRATPKPTPTPRPITLLDDTDSDDTQVRFTIQGRIVAKENHAAVSITIAKLHRNLDIFQAYSGTAEQSVTLDNNQPAFEDFLRALHGAGFDRVIKNPKAASTELGLCPLGQRYIYEIFRAGANVQRSWSTTCSEPTNFSGNPSTIRTLFQQQIPNYNQVAGKKAL